MVVDLGHEGAHLAELLLELGAAALGLEHVLAGVVRHRPQRHVAVAAGVGGEEHDGHAAASDLLLMSYGPIRL